MVCGIQINTMQIIRHINGGVGQAFRYTSIILHWRQTALPSHRRIPSEFHESLLCMQVYSHGEKQCFLDATHVTMQNILHTNMELTPMQGYNTTLFTPIPHHMSLKARLKPSFSEGPAISASCA